MKLIDYFIIKKKNKSSQRQIIIKLSKIKDKEKILKAERDKKFVSFKEILIRLSVECSEKKWKKKS